jgi:hypothetical protein
MVINADYTRVHIVMLTNYYRYRQYLREAITLQGGAIPHCSREPHSCNYGLVFVEACAA